jgi:hypothetical protein
MLIPKDSTIFIPIWQVTKEKRNNAKLLTIPNRALNNREENGYNDPETYNPDRFIDFPRLANDYAGSPDYNARDRSSPS